MAVLLNHSKVFFLFLNSGAPLDEDAALLVGVETGELRVVADFVLGELPLGELLRLQLVEDALRAGANVLK